MINYAKLVSDAKEFIKQHDLTAADVLACSAEHRLDTIQTTFGNIEVIVNRYLPPNTFFLVNKKQFEDRFPFDWIDDRATTNSL